MPAPAWLAKIFSSGATATLDSVTKAVDTLSTNAEERMTFKAKALDTVLDAHARVIEAEAQAGGLAVLWRPIASLIFVALILWITIASTFGYPVPNLNEIPGELWAFLMGYGSFRSAEKIMDKFRSKKEVKLALKGG